MPIISPSAIIGLVQSYFGGEAKKRDVEQLAVRYLGILLHEIRRNLAQTLELVSVAAAIEGGGAELAASPPSTMYGGLNFDASQVAFGEVCRVLPMPNVISTLQALIADLKQLDLQERMVLDDLPVAATGGKTELGIIGREVAALARVASVARRILARGRVREFNQIRAIAADLLRTAYEDDAMTMEPELLPMPLEEAAPAAATAPG